MGTTVKEQAVSKAYAQSLYQLGREKGVDITAEFVRLNEAINLNNDLENVLFMNVFTSDEKIDVVEGVARHLKLHRLAEQFLIFLIQEKRIDLFPVIFKNLVVIDDHEKGFLRGTIEGADDKIEEAPLAEIKNYLEKRLGTKTRLEYKKKLDVVAGYQVTVEDFQIDASLNNQLNKLKGNILNG